jgi:predicted Fe-Mo cluster-binding NifX family protein
MKIAVATEGAEVAHHFGRCSSYTIAEVEEGRVISKSLIDNPGHQPGFLPLFLAEKGVSCIIAGGMGPRAKDLFREQNILVITGVSGRVDQVLEDFVNDRLETGPDACKH